MVTIDDKLKQIADSLLDRLGDQADLGQTERVFKLLEQIMKIRQMNEFLNISKKE